MFPCRLGAIAAEHQGLHVLRVYLGGLSASIASRFRGGTV